MAADEALILVGLAFVGVCALLFAAGWVVVQAPLVLALVPLAALGLWEPWVLGALVALGVGAGVLFGGIYAVSAPRLLAMAVIAILLGICVTLGVSG